MNEKADKVTEAFLIELAKIIKKHREALGITIADLSEKAEVSIGVISDIINQRGRVPSLINFIKIANALKLSDDVILKLFDLKGLYSGDRRSSNTKLKIALKDYGLSHGMVENMMVQIDALLVLQQERNLRMQNHINNKQNK